LEAAELLKQNYVEKSLLQNWSEGEAFLINRLGEFGVLG